MTYETRAFEKIETELNNDVIFISKDLGDLACNPPGIQSSIRQSSDPIHRSSRNSLLHHFDVDLGHIHLLAEFRRKFGLLEQLSVYAGRHLGRKAYRSLPELDQMRRNVVCEDREHKARNRKIVGWVCGGARDVRSLKTKIARQVCVTSCSLRGNRADPSNRDRPVY